ncbi:hypothetical protein J7438_22945 [Thalassotalea sp. G20_0]|uniref:hypothetical protein n=1 Tax=Thalassotalea sp. G20_0 TaxID=2821093 RepID=UPI001ADB4B2D|nr:hypothetical protein [Thalassotalea sp. G20_0]MBO9496922.1 hypothetical protein [Thalassotalea sp. G20_0]
MRKYKVLKYHGRPKFITALNLLDTIFIIKPLNLISLFKLVVSYLLAPNLNGCQLKNHVDKELMAADYSFDFIVLGKEEDYQKATYIYKNTEEIKKILIFSSHKEADSFLCNFKEMHEVLKKEVQRADYLKIENVKLITLTNNKVELVTEYIEGIKYNWFFVLKYLPNILQKLADDDISTVVIKDFKLHNIVMKGRTLYIYDLETISIGNWSDSIQFFIDDLKFYSRYGFFCFLLKLKMGDFKGA